MVLVACCFLEERNPKKNSSVRSRSSDTATSYGRIQVFLDLIYSKHMRHLKKLTVKNRNK